MKKFILLILLALSITVNCYGDITKGLISKEDLRHYDGISDTFTRKTSTGGTATYHKIFTDGVDVLQVYGDGSTRTQACINNAIAQIGSRTTAIKLSPGTWVLSADVTIPSNTPLKVEPGAVITVATGVTLTINGPLSAESVRIFNCVGTGAVAGLQNPIPEWWTTNTTPGTTDMTTAIQAAIDNAKANGGGIVQLLPEKYLVSNLIIYDGVRLLGSGDSYGEGDVGTGTVLYSTTGSPIITINGAAGYGFEIAYLHILGDGTASQDGIFLNESGGSVPRSSYIHDISIVSVGRDGLLINGFSYISLDRINVVSAGRHGINITGGTTLKEFLLCNRVNTQSCTNNGINIATACAHLYFDNSDINDCAKGVYIEGNNTYNIFFKNLDVVRSTSYSIEIFADTSSLTRLFFDRTTIYMAGASADERAIYEHRTGSYSTSYSSFSGITIAKAGATAPTYSIEAGTLIYSEILGLWDNSGGAITSNVHAKVEFLQSYNTTFTDGDTTPDVTGRSVFKTGNTEATTITFFDGAHEGKTITVIFLDAVTTIDFTGTALKGNGGANWTPAVNDTMTCIYNADTFTWYCAISDNSS